MKKYILILLSLLLLAGCEGEEPAPTATPTPTPAPTSTPTAAPEPTPIPTHPPIGMEVDIGDGEHTFWAEAVDMGVFGSFELHIYKKKGDTQPFQILKDSCITGFQSLRWSAQDMDFDGYGDLSVIYAEAPNGHASFHYYIWNAEEEKFIPDPYGLNELCSLGSPDILPEEKAIRTFMRWSAGREGEIRFYRYLEEGFICVRQMFWSGHSDGEGADFLVENYENRELRRVYEETCSKESLNGYLWSEEFSKWDNLAYHGE